MTVPGQTIINQWREVGELAVRKFKTRPEQSSRARGDIVPPLIESKEETP